MTQDDLFKPREPDVSEFGTEPRKLARTNNPSTSVEAACKINSTVLEKMVYQAIKSFGVSGCIIEQVLDMYPHFPYSSITARPRALLDKGLIVVTGEKRECRSGCKQRVLRAV